MSRPRELHPQPLVKPDVRLSTHPASIIQPVLVAPPRTSWPADTLSDATPLLSPRYQASSLLRVAPPLCTVSVLSPSWYGPLVTFPVVACTPHHRTTGSRVPHTRLRCVHATFTPDTVWLETGTLQTPPRMDLRPWFRCHRARFRRVISGALAFISATHTRRSIAASFHIAHDHGS